MNAPENITRHAKQPVPYPKTVRNPNLVMNASARAGVVMPAAFIPLMPNDSLQAGSFVDVSLQMEETEKVLNNAIWLRAHAYFVAYPALDRFQGNDSVAFAWAQKDGAESIIDKFTYSNAAHDEFFHAFGEHIPNGDEINSLYLEAYNVVNNYRRSMISPKMAGENERDRLSATLARALWGQTALARIVPDFDAGLMDASAVLTYNGAQLPVTGDATVDGFYTGAAGSSGAVYDADGNIDYTKTTSDARIERDGTVVNSGHIKPTVSFDDVVAELTGSAGSISLAAIKNAERTKAFAEMRRHMAGTDEDLINMLMRGFSIPNQAYADPMFMGKAEATLAQLQRYATDANNLDKFVANGSGGLRIPLNLPEQTTGGVIVITYEIVPEPVFDRQYDPFLYKDFEELPNALRDYLDTQPVESVPNRFVDALHTEPDKHFGFAPLNYDWSMSRIKMAGRYLRTLSSDASDEDQQHIWSVRTVDPTLGEDTFLVPADFAHTPFVDTLADPFIVQVSHLAKIQGITQFGPALYESTADYEAVASVVPDDTLTPPSEGE